MNEQPTNSPTINLFHPRTFSTDWEVMVLDKLDREVEGSKLDGFAGQLSDEFDLNIKTDWNTIEFALGINRTLDQLWTRIRTATDRASQLVREYDLDCCPVAGHPISRMYNAAHIHIGTLADEAAGIRLEAKLTRWIPVFIALAANSPLQRNKPTRFKSWRVRDGANWCVEPSSFRNPATSMATWGTDGGPKLYGAPTLEVRVTDCASSRRFLAEMATFVAAFVQTLGTKSESELPAPTERDYRTYLNNRWNAARYGMQASLRWGDGERPVAEIASEMLEEAKDALAILGATRGDLTVIETMIAKRLCQADLPLEIARRYDDPYVLGNVLQKRMRDWNAFDEWAQNAKPLEPVPTMTDEQVLEEHLAFIGEGMHFYNTRETMFYPSVFADQVIEQLIERGKIVREVSELRGQTLTRVA